MIIINFIMCSVRLTRFLVIVGVLTSGATRDPVTHEFRIKYFSHPPVLKTMQILPVPDCPSVESYASTNPDRLQMAIMQLYRPILHSVQEFGYLVTAYSIKTHCEVSFFGYKMKTVLIDQPVSLDLIIPSLHQLVLVELTDRLKQGTKNGPTEFLRSVYPDESYLYNCPWLSSGELSSIIYRIKLIHVVWSPSGTLIQPLIDSSCLHNNQDGFCKLSKHSFLLFTPTSDRIICDYTRMTSMEGALSIKNEFNKSIHFDAYESNFMTTFSIRQKQPTVLCPMEGNWIMLSNEGHIVSFLTTQGDHPLELLSKSANFPLLPMSQWKVDNSSSRPKRMIVDTIIREPPPLKFIVGMNDLENDSGRRDRREALWYYPEHQRILMLQEHISWGFSELEAFSNRVGREMELFNLHLRFQQCTQRKHLLLSLLEGKLYTQYIRLQLKDPSAQFIKATRYSLTIHQGIAVGSAMIPSWDNKTQCSNMIKITVRLPDSDSLQDCWLVNEIGACLHPEYVKECEPGLPNRDFLIPSYKSGSFSLQTNAYIHSKQFLQHKLSLELTFMDLKPDSGDEQLVSLERSMGSYVPSGKVTRSLQNIRDMYLNPSSLSLPDVTDVLSDLVLPGFISSWVFIIAGLVVFFCCCGKCQDGKPYSSVQRSRLL